MYNSMTPRRSRARAGLSVRTFIPARTGVVHEAGKPRWPSISTRHRRHEPNGSSESVAQSFGMWIPASAAARITEVPSGTDTARPSISNAMLEAFRRSGVAQSLSARDRMSARSSWGRDRQIVTYECHIPRRQTEILRKIFQRTQHRQRSQTAERAQRTELHRIAKIAEHF